MGIDTTTELKNVAIVFENNKEYLKKLLEESKVYFDGMEGWENNYVIHSGNHRPFRMMEYYFDEEENSLKVSGEMESEEGWTSIGFELPLSDTVLIDILNHAVKKLNKLKAAMENLK